MEFREDFFSLSDQKKLRYLYKEYLPDLYEKENDFEIIEKKVLPEKYLDILLTKKIKEFQNSSKKILLTSVSGFSGVGKTFAVKKLEEIAKKENLPEEVIGIDIFIGTARNSKERIEMAENRKNFQKNFYTGEILRNFLSQIAQGKYGEQVSEEGIYNRKDGGKLNGKIDFKIPKEKYLLMLEGFNSTKYAKEVENNNPETVDHFDLVILDDPAESLARALFRDVSDKNKQVDLENRMIERLKEYSHMWVDIFKNIRKADYIIFNNKASSAINYLFEDYLELTGNSREEVLEVLKLAEKKFNQEKFAENENRKFPIRSSLVKHFVNKLRERMNKIIKEVAA